MQLNAKLRSLSKRSGVDVRILRQNFMLERFLERTAISPHSDSFILKGGILIAATVGISSRTTLDLDATLKLEEISLEEMKGFITDIISVSFDDNVGFSIISIDATQHDGGRRGFKVMLEAVFDQSHDILKLDISVGDVVTPRAARFGYKTMFGDRTINVWAYNTETVLAEKLEAILSLNILTTRMKDFYDVYILTATQKQNIEANTLAAAIRNTSGQRESTHLYTSENVTVTLHRLANDITMLSQWKRYQQKNPYASGISFGDTLDALQTLAEWGNLIAKKTKDPSLI
jgi:predicted nucleotidyltransferase component of viral defense system